jgi:hypothetical protein
MTIKLAPTKIKKSLYLLVPKNIADLVEIDKKTMVSLSIKKIQNENILEYKFENSVTN